MGNIKVLEQALTINIRELLGGILACEAISPLLRAQLHVPKEEDKVSASLISSGETFTDRQ